jgi:hypothetical protein
MARKARPSRRNLVSESAKPPALKNRKAAEGCKKNQTILDSAKNMKLL